MRSLRNECMERDISSIPEDISPTKLTIAGSATVSNFSHLVPVDDLDNIRYYSLILGKEFNPHYYPANEEFLNSGKIDWANEIDKINRVFAKIPTIHKRLSELGLALKDEDKNPERIDKSFVHKADIENVLISQPSRFGNIWYFNMLTETKEFIFDHKSDHLEGMMLMEIARQTGIATTHLNGLPIEGRLNMSSMSTKFYNYIELGSPVLIRSISNFANFSHGDSDKSHVIVNLIQFGKICSTIFLEGVMFKDKSGIQNYRDRSIKINHKFKDKYLNSLNEIR